MPEYLEDSDSECEQGSEDQHVEYTSHVGQFNTWNIRNWDTIVRAPRMKSATQDRHSPDRPYPKIGIGQTEQTLATLGQTEQTLTTIGQTEQTFSRPVARPNRTMARPLSRSSARPLCRPWARPNRPYARTLSRPSARPLSIPLARPNRLLARPLSRPSARHLCRFH